MITMTLTHLFIPSLLAITTFWTYMHTNVERQTGEILGAFTVTIVAISIVWFVASAPWFLNLGIAIALMLNNRY
ncbi:hypothetical protein [Argonema galeatum]|uniref:hypothetical protein n=1 Tax=Argonema galeatum TaxID=2942762 RepID=UPI00201372FD|nr:hypothetical protein [Argonema galeatum]MCL1463151.1 hypothetical protein [Argonema galeatum A003/A1]